MTGPPPPILKDLGWKKNIVKLWSNHLLNGYIGSMIYKDQIPNINMD